MWLGRLSRMPPMCLIGEESRSWPRKCWRDNTSKWAWERAALLVCSHNLIDRWMMLKSGIQPRTKR